ncbi:MAG: beta-1,6-glucan synthase [Rhodospirillales bacterium]|nr:beta-1,6-glucan synthase [Rhodospirillales bacterium]
MRLGILPPALAAFALAATMSIAAWAWLGRPVPLPDVAGGRLQCLSYAPSHGGAPPFDEDFVLPGGLIEADMERLKPITGCIRTYSSLGNEGDAVAAAANIGIKVMIGIWIGADDRTNAKEIEGALSLAVAYPEAVKMLVVGNEVLLRREMTADRLAGIIRSVKARTPHPVTYADIFEFWRRNPALAEVVDAVTVHILPYWDDPTPVGIDAVQDHVRGIIEKAYAAFPDKPLQIGETGWPSAGRTRGAAAPSLVNQARFVREFAIQADALGVGYNIIEAVDQPWKRAPEGTVGGYWGVLDKHRDPKFAFAGPVREWPGWRWAAGFTVAGAALAVGWALAAGRMLSLARWAAAAAAGAAVAGVLAAFAAQALDFAIGVHGALWGIYLWLVAAAGGVLLTRVAAGWPPPEATRLAAYRRLVLVPAAMVALALAVDGRHRDFLTLAFALPAAALILFGGNTRRPSVADGWIGGALAACGPLAVDSLGNREAIAWALCCLALAYPLRGAIAAELRRLRAGLRQQQDGGHHRHG